VDKVSTRSKRDLARGGTNYLQHFHRGALRRGERKIKGGKRLPLSIERRGELRSLHPKKKENPKGGRGVYASVFFQNPPGLREEGLARNEKSGESENAFLRMLSHKEKEDSKKKSNYSSAIQENLGEEVA